MDDPSKLDPGATPPVTGAVDPAARDLSFLWPVIDRIRAVEIKFQGDGPPPAAADTDARLRALEEDIAAIRKTLQEALSTLAEGVREAAVTVAEALELLPQTWRRATAGAVIAVVLLLIAHSLVVFVYDVPTLILRLVSITIPLPIGLWMTLRRRIRPGFEIGVALLIGVVAVGGMSFVTSVHEHSSFLPEDGREWRETAEYVASVAFAYLTGVLLSAGLQARSGAPNRASRATLKLAQAIASVTGKAVTTGPQIKKRVDQIQDLIRALAVVASAAMAIVTGLKSVMH